MTSKSIIKILEKCEGKLINDKRSKIKKVIVYMADQGYDTTYRFHAVINNEYKMWSVGSDSYEDTIIENFPEIDKSMVDYDFLIETGKGADGRYFLIYEDKTNILETIIPGYCIQNKIEICFRL